MTQRTTSKSVFISGGTSGIGHALARGFAQAGHRVTASGIGQLPDNEENIEFISLDVTDGDAVAGYFNEIKTLDTLINAAGIIRREEEHHPKTFEQVVDTNLNGTMRLCSAARNTLSLAKGSIINIASMLSYFGGGLVPGYAASKGGVVQLTKSLAIAYAKDDIRVNAIAPGWIETPLTGDLRADSKRNQSIVDRTPLGRWGDPSELVGPALFLASEEASFVTGTVLNVDGGYAAM
ncbi:MAG: 2-deoxy-D-gluconate 3-dehydrogenase [Opitutaceae bacterium]|nr:2-deoxy-D-gluconate 3-dehydrogenase [Opitutaceae bacterium]